MLKTVDDLKQFLKDYPNNTILANIGEKCLTISPSYDNAVRITSNGKILIEINSDKYDDGVELLGKVLFF